MSIIEIAGLKIGNGHPAQFVAEVGSNHNGSIELAKRYIVESAQAGASIVKFQTYTADGLVNPEQRPEVYQLIDKISFSVEDLIALRQVSDENDVVLLTTPFSVEAVERLDEAGFPAYKIASGDLTYTRLLKAVAQTRKPIILSTGLATLEEVEHAMASLKKFASGPVILLHCSTKYPAPLESVNIRAVATLAERFSVPVGFSDHTQTDEAALASVALGGVLIEKHVTFNPKEEGPDHHFALEMKQFKNMVEKVRRLEKLMGDGIKKPSIDEIRGPRWRARRGVYAKRDLFPGDILMPDDLLIVRPSNLISADQEEFLVGMVVKAPVRQYEPLCWDKLVEHKS